MDLEADTFPQHSGKLPGLYLLQTPSSSDTIGISVGKATLMATRRNMTRETRRTSKATLLVRRRVSSIDIAVDTKGFDETSKSKCRDGVKEPS